MVYILSIETATTNCSVSLSVNGRTILLKEDYDKNYSHAERLHVYIDDILKETNVNRKKLNAIAISKGPGSYTGLRIGVSAAKGLCYALDLPLISIPTLESLSHQVKEQNGVIVPMLDARRQEVYSAVFDTQHCQIRDTQAQIIDYDAFGKYLKEDKVYFIGNGVEKTMTHINHPNAVFIKGKLPSANDMGALAYNKFKINEFENVAYFEPYYLKDFIAIKPKL
ncbi:tRNA (adenosine(37)-N6)-threonylcarbamoyltransferase complex dimerization subunit type 1 TsaB [Aestuariivivens sediminis]|uniref:tRNA (adenosine(37)-N6)-threonylcarbamoyltransferase complex dimerization subunit type 1 TsaB n=1 Tax=Aestuariivivens sediminis TaxID=2913557 RepID=UPI001F5AF78D|nr:tRNA (adenosine(37)-N6)-threonylcarbamoyltransferase complex dimerization subunit type 1 TsaB [Aestuariivivens sediminis]